VRYLATFCLTLLCAPLVKAQHQEPSLIDRLLRPNMELQNNAQGMKFTTNSAFVERRGTVGTFYLPPNSTRKQFTDVRDYSATAFPSRAFNSDRGAVATTQSQSVKADAQLGASSVCDLRETHDAHAEVTGRSFAGQRAFQEQGKSQKSLDRKNPPLTIDQVRELLNKNK
jgi:hypothetical protein